MSQIFTAATEPPIPASTILAKAKEIEKLYTEKMVRKQAASQYTGSYPAVRGTPPDTGWIHEQAGQVTQWFNSFLVHDPAPMLATAERCFQIGAGVGPQNQAHGQLIGLGRSLPAGFQGKAAGAFFTKYVNVHEAVTGNQRDAMVALGTALKCSAGIHCQTRATLKETAEKAVAALKGDGADGGKILLAVLGTVAAIAGTVATGGAAAVAWSAASVAAKRWSAASVSTSVTGSLVNAAATTDTIHKEISGSSPEAVLQSLKTALDKVWKEVEGEQQSLVQRIQAARGTMWNMWQGNVRSLDTPGWEEPHPGTHIDGKPASGLVVAPPG